MYRYNTAIFVNNIINRQFKDLLYVFTSSASDLFFFTFTISTL